MSTHYETLGVDPTDTQDTIRRAYRSLMLQHHPDVAGEQGRNQTTMINLAWSVLRDADTRAAYDDSLNGDQRPAADAEGEPEEAEFEDEWGSVSDWADPVAETGHDDTPDVPEPPPPAPPQGDQAESLRYPAKRLGPVVAITLAMMAVWGLVSARLPGTPTDVAMIAAVEGIAVVAGLVVGYVGQRKYKMEWIAPAALLLLGVFAVEGMVDPPVQGWLRMGYLFPGAAGLASYTTNVLARQRSLNNSIPLKTLRDNNSFGTLPGGVAADLLDQDCTVLYRIPGVRVIRAANENALVSHFIVRGDKVALLKAVLAPGGTYRWSGPSLMREGHPMPDEVIRADYAGYLQGLGLERCASWLIVYSTDGVAISAHRGTPKIVAPDAGMDEVGQYLTDDTMPVVDQERFVQVAHAALTN